MKIVWTRLAIADIGHVRDYIAEDNPSAAVIERIGKAVQSLCSYPNLGRSGRVTNTRELIIGGTPFLVPYRIKKHRIEILAVLHGARRWPESF